MNYSIIRNLIGKILILLGLLMLPSVVVALINIKAESYRNVVSFLIPIATLLIIGALFSFKKAKNASFGAREGFVIVALSWILMSVFGCIPFLISGEIDDFFTAFFEITSGFTTTGASALTSSELESLSKSMLFWRSFSHWIGGMGILVFILAVIPESKEGSAVHILRAESPGPQVGKLVSKMQVTSRILYLIYIGLTVLETIILLILPDEKIGLFEALIYSFGTAGTGGFATTAASIGAYSACTQYCIAIFMIIFGINFSMFYFALIGNWKDIIQNEELRWYLIIIVLSVSVVCANTYSIYNNFEGAFRHSLFQVASIISTTGYSTTNYETWPVLSVSILIILTVFGSCAGSTSGGIKMSRFIILTKESKSKIKNMISPRKVEVVWMDGKPLDKNVIESVNAYFIIYIMTLFACSLLISIYNPNIENLDPLSSITASLTCISNVGPGLVIVGPSGGFADFSGFSKMVLSFEMIAGRLELFPMFILFSPRTWRKRI